MARGITEPVAAHLHRVMFGLIRQVPCVTVSVPLVDMAHRFLTIRPRPKNRLA